MYSTSTNKLKGGAPADEMQIVSALASQHGSLIKKESATSSPQISPSHSLFKTTTFDPPPQISAAEVDDIKQSQLD